MKSLSIFLLIISACCYSLFPQKFWQQMNGPNKGGMLITAATTSGDVYLCTQTGGLYKSTNNGLKWVQMIDSMFTNSVIVAKNGNIVVGGTYNMVSTDNGNSWKESQYINDFGTLFRGFFCFALSPTGELYAGNSQGVYRSTDGGLTYDTTASNTNAAINSLAVNAQGHIFAATQGPAIFRSTNRGNTWEVKSPAFSNGTSPNALAIRQSTGEVYVSGNIDKIFRSSDNGETWGAIFYNGIGTEINGLCVTASGALISAEYSRIVRTSDNGANWDTVYAFEDGWLRAVRQAPNGKIYICGARGVYRSDDDGFTWTEYNEGLSLTSVYSLAQNSSGYIFAGTYDNGLFRSTDHGNNWSKMAVPDYVHSVTVAPNGSVYAGTYREFWGGSGIHRSTDNGASWSHHNAEGATITAVGYNSLGHIFAGTAGVLFRSVDNGDTWNRINEDIGGYVNCIVQKNNGVMYIGTDYGIYKSVDNGQTWSITLSNLSSPGIMTIVFTSSGKIYAAGKGIYASNDEGVTWQTITAPDDFVFALAVTSGNYLYAGTLYNGIFRSNADNIDWRSVQSGLNIKSFRSFLIDQQGFLFAGSDGRSVFRTVNTTTDVTTETNPVSEFHLYQNYPNPFNPTTEIRFDIKEEALTTLKIYDITGRLVKTLINEIMTAGSKSVKFNSEELSSGVYFYQLMSGNYISTRKMILIR